MHQCGQLAGITATGIATLALACAATLAAIRLAGALSTRT